MRRDKKTCTKCRLAKPRSDFYSDRGKKDKLCTCCKNCFDKLAKRYVKTKMGRFITYKRHAKQRGLDFTITYERFISFWNMDCTYCGVKVKGVGLDRVDNSIGYTNNNVTQCCMQCNYAKRQMDVDELITHCKKIVSRHKKGITAKVLRQGGTVNHPGP